MRVKLMVYLVARALGLFALCRFLTRSRVRILGYHGASVGDEGLYNPFLFISIATFRRRIRWLRRKGFSVIPLEQAVDALDPCARDIGRLPTVITFDDGWHSTARQLVPALAENHLPSTLYLSTNDFQRGLPVLAVAINYMIWKSTKRRLLVEGLGEAIDGNYLLDEPGDRSSFVRKNQQWLSDPSATRKDVISRIHRLAEAMGLDQDELALETRRFDYVSRDELLELAKQGCMVEMHGHEHRYPKGQPQVFAADLAACRKAIVELGLPEPHHYCYPSGNFDDGAAAVLERLGVRSATTCIPALISRANDHAKRYALPRFLDGEHISALDFEAEMSGFAYLLRRGLGR